MAFDSIELKHESCFENEMPILVELNNECKPHIGADNQSVISLQARAFSLPAETCLLLTGIPTFYKNTSKQVFHRHLD